MDEGTDHEHTIEGSMVQHLFISCLASLPGRVVSNASSLVIFLLPSKAMLPPYLLSRFFIGQSDINSFFSCLSRLYRPQLFISCPHSLPTKETLTLPFSSLDVSSCLSSTSVVLFPFPCTSWYLFMESKIMQVSHSPLHVKTMQVRSFASATTSLHNITYKGEE